MGAGTGVLGRARNAAPTARSGRSTASTIELLAGDVEAAERELRTGYRPARGDRRRAPPGDHRRLSGGSARAGTGSPRPRRLARSRSRTPGRTTSSQQVMWRVALAQVQAHAGDSRRGRAPGSRGRGTGRADGFPRPAGDCPTRTRARPARGGFARGRDVAAERAGGLRAQGEHRRCRLGGAAS